MRTPWRDDELAEHRRQMAPVLRLGPMHLPTIVERDRFAEVAGANQGQEALEQHLPQGQQFLEESTFDRVGRSAIPSRPIDPLD